MRVQTAVFVLVLLLAGGGWDTGKAQHATRLDTSRAASGSAHARLLSGIEGVKAGRYERSIDALRPLFEQDSISLSPREKEAVAYWLGTAYDGQGRAAQAIDVWGRGVAGTNAEGVAFSYRRADAYIEAVMETEATPEYARAVDAYFRLLRRLDTTRLQGRAEDIVRRHLREIAVVLPPALQRRTGIAFDRRTFATSVDRTADAGEILVGWWRSQDVLPATNINERVREHLERVVYARSHFLHEGRLDDRGKLYIRFGEPRRDLSIGMEDQETTSRIAARLRRNEFWTYPAVDQSKGYYLLVEKDPERFTVGGVMDLFPPDMMPGREYLYAMEEVLRELATFHGDYGTAAADVFARASRSRSEEQFGVGPDPIEGPVRDFVRKMENHLEVVDRQSARRRARRLPPSWSRVADAKPDLPVAARTARFLTPNGRTKFQVYWGLPPSALQYSDDIEDTMGDESEVTDRGFLLRTTLLQERANHRRETVRTRRHLVSPSSETQGFPSQTVSVTVEESPFHVAAQWDLRAAQRNAGDDSLRLSSVLRRRTERHDTLSVLHAGTDRLEMSDLKLVTVAPDAPPTAVTTGRSRPYPYRTIESTQPLALHFEVYHLGLGPEGQSRYTVSYRARRKADRGFLAGLFGGGEEEQTTTTTTYTGEQSRTSEYILLDLESLVDEKARTVTMTVQVQDERTGQNVARTVSIEVVPPTEND